MTDSPAARPDRLAELEAVIERGMATFVEVGAALMEVRDGRLYRPENGGRWGAFEDYCRERWGFSRIHAHRLMTAADAVAGLLPMGNGPAPASERQARELAAIPAGRRAEVWQEAVERHGPQPTAAAIRAIARPEALPVEDLDGPALFPRTSGRFAVVDTGTGEIVGDAEPVAPVPTALAERIDAINQRTAVVRSRELDAAARLVVIAADYCRVDPDETARQALDHDPATADVTARSVPGLVDWLTRYAAALRAPGNRVRMVR